MEPQKSYVTVQVSVIPSQARDLEGLDYNYTNTRIDSLTQENKTPSKIFLEGGHRDTF